MPAISNIMFKKYDTDNSGSITIKEFRNMSYDLGYYLSDTELELAVKKLDRTGSGSITYDDFKSWWGSNDRWNTIKLSDDDMEILSAISVQFQKFDKDKSGSIEKKEFKNFWKAVNNKKKVSSSEEEAMFKALDSNGDGHISFNEFVDYLYGKYKGDLSQYFAK